MLSYKSRSALMIHYDNNGEISLFVCFVFVLFLFCFCFRSSNLGLNCGRFSYFTGGWISRAKTSLGILFHIFTYNVIFSKLKSNK